MSMNIVQELEMLKSLHEPTTIEELAERMGVSRQTIVNWRSDLRDGIEFLGSKIQVFGDTDFQNGGKMRTTVHPLFFPANLSQVYVLLNALLEYSRRHAGSPSSAVARGLAEEVEYQLSDYAYGILDEAIERNGHKVPRKRQPTFQSDQHEEMLYVMLEKNGAEIRLQFNQEGRYKSILGHFDGRRRIRDRACFIPSDGGQELFIPWDDIIEVTIPRTK